MPTWCSSPGGNFWADLDGLRLIVHAGDPAGSPVRFSVLRRQYGQGSPFGIVGSDVENDCPAAMKAAQILVAGAGASVPDAAGHRGEGANGAAGTRPGQSCYRRAPH